MKRVIAHEAGYGRRGGQSAEGPTMTGLSRTPETTGL